LLTFFAHPLIASLFQGKYDPAELAPSRLLRTLNGDPDAKDMPLNARRNLPSYIPFDQFAKALVDLIGRGPVSVNVENAANTPLTVEQFRERAAALTSLYLSRIVISAIAHADGSLGQLKST